MLWDAEIQSSGNMEDLAVSLLRMKKLRYSYAKFHLGPGWRPHPDKVNSQHFSLTSSDWASRAASESKHGVPGRCLCWGKWVWVELSVSALCLQNKTLWIYQCNWPLNNRALNCYSMPIIFFNEYPYCFWSVVASLQMQRASCMHWSMSFFIVQGIWVSADFGIQRKFWNPIHCRYTEGQIKLPGSQKLYVNFNCARGQCP